jgi:hypothetical protein
MGEPSSCAQANSVCLDAEQRFHTARDASHGDSARITTLGFVDDLFFAYAYDRAGRVWSAAEARELLAASCSMYPPPLALE